MSRTHAGKLVLGAKSTGSAVGAFNVILLEHAEALVAGAELAKLPVILQISQNCVNYHKALKPISVATIAIAESSSVPVSVHLDHAESEELVKQALDLGYDSVMFDGSKLSYADNVAASARMAALCAIYGATLEVEIGEVGGKDGVHAPGVRTNPLEAKAFAEATGTDLLAVAVGSSHAMTTRDATLDFDLIQEIAKTDSAVVITQGSKTIIRGTGMIYDKGQETFTLLKNVKVHYEKPASIKTESPNKKGNEKDSALQHKNKPSKIAADTKKKKR